METPSQPRQETSQPAFGLVPAADRRPEKRMNPDVSRFAEHDRTMDDRRKLIMFAALAAVVAASTAPIAADSSRPSGLLVVLLIIVAVLLFVAGYYAGSLRKR
jgi:hypothetical protein